MNNVAFNGVACNKATVKSGQYAGVARFYEVTSGQANGAASAVHRLDRILGAAKKIISSQWIPIN